MEYITTKEASSKWGISTTRITILANEGRIPGAMRLGKSWLIPASATKPEVRRANHSSTSNKKINTFQCPLFHFRPNWNNSKEGDLSTQQHNLLLAETAVLECRFADALPLLESILLNPEDIYTEIGCLWNAGICCIYMNKSKEFFRIFSRLQLLLSKNCPHRDDLMVIPFYLKTYIETIDSIASEEDFNIDIHEQCMPLLYVKIGYTHLSKEIMHPGSADTTLLELGLRYLKNTSSIIAVELMHCYLYSIYNLRQDKKFSEKHAKEIVQIAFENKLLLPLITYFRYTLPQLSEILVSYPEEFNHQCLDLINQYDINFTEFIESIAEYSVFSKLTVPEYPYAYAILMDLTNEQIAEKLDISVQTVKRRLQKIYEKIGVNTKREFKEYIQNNL